MLDKVFETVGPQQQDAGLASLACKLQRNAAYHGSWQLVTCSIPVGLGPDPALTGELGAPAGNAAIISRLLLKPVLRPHHGNYKLTGFEQ